MYATANGDVSVTVYFCSTSSKVNEALLNVLLHLLTMRMNDENKYILVYKRIFSDILEGISSTIFWGQAPHTSFQLRSLLTDYYCT